MRETFLIRLFSHHPEPGHGKEKNLFFNIIKITKKMLLNFQSKNSPNFLN